MRLGWIQSIILFLDRIEPPGLQGLSVWKVGSFFVEGIAKGALATRAAAISFRLFLAFFPGLILLLTIIPIIPVPNFQQNLLDSIRGFFPGDTYDLFESTFLDLITREHNALLSIGFVLVIYYASNSINAILLGFNDSYHLDKRHNPIVMRVASIVLIFVLGLFMILAISMIIFSGSLFNYLHEVGIIPDKGIIPLLVFIKWIITTFLIYTVISTLYNVGHGNRRKRWKFFNAGSTFATLFFIVTSIVFAWFVNNVAQYNRLYGSLGTLLVLLIWLNFNCMILLMGFDLNVSIAKARRMSFKPPPKPKNTVRESVE